MSPTRVGQDRNIPVRRRPATTFAVLLAGWLFILAQTPSAAKEPTFWFSNNFSARPKVHFSHNTPAHPTRITAFDDINRASRDGDIRLCFDNRPLDTARVWNLDTISQDPLRFRFCEYARSDENVGYFGEERRRNGEDLTRGVVVSAPSGISIYGTSAATCEAIFTVGSFFSLLSYYDEENPEKFGKIDELTPYGEGLFVSERTTEGMRKFLMEPDSFHVGSSLGRYWMYSGMNMDKSWECLAPAFNLYWEAVLSRCRLGIDELRKSDKKRKAGSRRRLYYSVLTDVKDDMFAIADHCYQRKRLTDETREVSD